MAAFQAHQRVFPGLKNTLSPCAPALPPVTCGISKFEDFSSSSNRTRRVSHFPDNGRSFGSFGGDTLKIGQAGNALGLGRSAGVRKAKKRLDREHRRNSAHLAKRAPTSSSDRSARVSLAGRVRFNPRPARQRLRRVPRERHQKRRASYSADRR